MRDMAKVLTVLEPEMRALVNAATKGTFTMVHAESVTDALQAASGQTVQALLLSPMAIARDQLAFVGRLVLKCPGAVAVAVVGESSPATAERLLDLGAHGVRQLLDLSVRDGWNRLRGLVEQACGETAFLILAAVIPALGEPSEETSQFFQVLVHTAPCVGTVKEFSRALCVLPSTMLSRFFRAGLPSPKKYLATTRLLYATAFLEVPGRSVADVAHRLEYSSPQSFGRHVREVLGITAGELRREHHFSTVLDHYTSQLIVPFRTTFRWFDPLGPGVLPNR
jgi:AraC-like DNA-binding protein